MKGYKVFNPDWTCRGFHFEVGQTYEEDVNPAVCNRGFHFCEKAADCFKFYSFDPNNKVAEVLAMGEISTDGVKSCTNKIRIVREITWEELLTIVNTGKGCSGFCNSGDCNSGFCNSGNRNSGNRNSGDCNSGNRNSGNRNSGDWNSGDCNSGDWNSGNRNSGFCNSGDWNSGNRNSGFCNSGDCNSGFCNSGNRNSGNRNSGDCNSGDWNSGDCNSGDWNLSSHSSGCFGTENQPVMFFDKPSAMTFDQWRRSEACRLLNQIDFRPTEWIGEDYMSEDEKKAHPEYKTTGGYLKERNTSDCCRVWWDSLDSYQKQVIQCIPNFDPEKFYKITGIKVGENG